MKSPNSKRTITNWTKPTKQNKKLQSNLQIKKIHKNISLQNCSRKINTYDNLDSLFFLTQCLFELFVLVISNFFHHFINLLDILFNIISVFSDSINMFLFFFLNIKELKNSQILIIKITQSSSQLISSLFLFFT